MQPRQYEQDDEDVIPLGLDEDDEAFDEEWDEDGGFAPGPDERDRDLMDGTWERRQESGKGGRDWNTIGLAIGIIAVIAMVLPGILVLLG